MARWAEVVGCVLAHARACLRELSGDTLGRLSAELRKVERLNFDFEEDGEVDDLVEGLAALMLPHDGVDREHLLEVAGGCLLAPFDDDAIEVLRVLADPTKCRVELSTAAFRGDECPPEVPCAPGCPRCAGRGGFHAALAKLMPAKPPPPPASNDVPATWAPFSGLATRRPAESPQIEPRFGTEHWTAPVPPGLLEAWSTCDDWPALGLPAPNAFVVDAPALKPGSTKARPAPTADEAADADRAAQACKAFADAWRRRAGGPAKKKRKGKPSSADVALSKLVEGFPAAPDATDAAPMKIGDVWVLPRPERFELPTLYVRARLTGAAAPTVVDAATLQLVSALVADAVAEDLYPATVAGLDYTISAVLDADALALSLKCGGFDEKVPALFDALLRGVRRAADEVFEPRAFAAAKSEVALSLRTPGTTRTATRAACACAASRRGGGSRRRSAARRCKAWTPSRASAGSAISSTAARGALSWAATARRTRRGPSTRRCGPCRRSPRRGPAAPWPDSRGATRTTSTPRARTPRAGPARSSATGSSARTRRRPDSSRTCWRP